MKSLPILLYLILLSGISMAQDNSSNYTVNVGYFGNNLWNEGFRLGLEKPRDTYTKTNKSGKERTIVRSYSANLNLYHDSDSHTGVFITAGWSRKKHLNNRWNFSTSLEPIGLYRSFLPETYEVDDNGDVSRVSLPGRFYLSPSASAGFGRVSKENPDNGWYARANITTLFPYNRVFMPLFNIEFGYHFSFKMPQK